MLAAISVVASLGLLRVFIGSAKRVDWETSFLSSLSGFRGFERVLSF